MRTDELGRWLHRRWPEVRAELEAGTYRPQPVRRVMIRNRRAAAAVLKASLTGSRLGAGTSADDSGTKVGSCWDVYVQS